MWVRFWVSGKSQAEHYTLLADDYSDDDIKDEAEEWASNTSQGKLNDHYRFGFEKLAGLPKTIKDALIENYKGRIQHAEWMLRVLAETKVTP